MIGKNIVNIYIMPPRRKSMRKMRNSKKPRFSKTNRRTRKMRSLKNVKRNGMSLHRLLTDIL